MKSTTVTLERAGSWAALGPSVTGDNGHCPKVQLQVAPGSDVSIQKLAQLRSIVYPSEVARGQGQVAKNLDIITSGLPLWLGLFPKFGYCCEVGII